MPIDRSAGARPLPRTVSAVSRDLHGWGCRQAQGWQLLALPPAMIGFTCLVTRAPTALRGAKILVDDAGITYRPAKRVNPTVFMPWSKIASITVPPAILPRLEIFMQGGYRLPPTGRPGVYFRRGEQEFVLTRNGFPVRWNTRVSFQPVIGTFPLKRLATALETHIRR